MKVQGMASPGDAILGLCDNDLEHLSNSVFSRIEKDRPSGEPINKPGLWSSWVDGGCPSIFEPCSRFVEVLLRNESEDTEKAGLESSLRALLRSQIQFTGQVILSRGTGSGLWIIMMSHDSGFESPSIVFGKRSSCHQRKCQTTLLPTWLVEFESESSW